MTRLLAILLLAATLRADELSQKMAARLSQEADAFRKLAPQMLGEETLHQKAQRTPGRFHPHLADTAAAWQDRTVVSEYGFTNFAGEGDSLHELRQVISVDGHKVGDARKAQDALAKIITLKEEDRKRELLKDFEKHGLSGAVTDFGQLILLFTPSSIPRYEFSTKGQTTVNGLRILVFAYSQIDGPDKLTLFAPNDLSQPTQMRAKGEVWVRADNFLPLRITLSVTQGEGPTAIHEDAAVDYAMSEFGTLLPAATNHRELRGGQVVAENHFVYKDFHEFGGRK